MPTTRRSRLSGPLLAGGALLAALLGALAVLWFAGLGPARTHGVQPASLAREEATTDAPPSTAGRPQDRTSSAAPLPAASRRMEACFQDGAGVEAALPCLRAIGARPWSPEELGAWACATPLGLREIVACLSTCVLVAEEELLSFAAHLQEACPRLSERAIGLAWLGAFVAAEPGRFQRLEALLEPAAIYDEARGEGMVQLLEYFAAEGSPLATSLLEEGGRGIFGGSPQQVDRAALITLVLRRGPGEVADYVESLLEAPALGRNYALGCTIGELLVRGGAADGARGAERRMQGLRRSLSDPRFQDGVAAQLLGHEGPPAGVDPGAWAELQEEARELLSTAPPPEAPPPGAAAR